MPYTPPDIQDAPSTATPLSSANIKTWLSGAAAHAEGSVILAPAPTGTASTDRAAIQTALSSASPGDLVRLAAGSVYTLNSQGTKAFKTTSSSTTVGFCLQIPSGVTLDLNGSTLQYAAGAGDVVMVCNTATNAATDTNIGLIGYGTIDGNANPLPGASAVRFEGVTGLVLDLRLYNTSGYGLYVTSCSKIEAPRIHSDLCTGQPINLGDPGDTTPAGARYVRNSHFGSITSRNVTNDPINVFNRPGNPIYMCASNTTVDLMQVENGEAGIKVDRPTVDLQIGKAIGKTNLTNNSGLKLQGDGNGYPLRVTVGELHMIDQYGAGLWMDKCVDCTVGIYTGESNGGGNQAADVWIGGIRDTVVQCRSTNTGTSGVLIRDYADDYTLGVVDVLDANRSGTASINGVTVGANSHGHMGIVRIIDRGSPAIRHDRGFRITANSSTVTVDKLIVRGFITAAYTIASGSPSAAKRVAVLGTDTHLQIGLNAVVEPMSPDVQVFTANGTWNKPAGCTTVMVALISSGGGGGSGRRGAAGTIRCAGGGGGGGAQAAMTFPASVLGATESVIVPGTASAGGAAIGTDDTDGQAGSSGSAASFGTKLRVNGGVGGGGGTASAGTGGTGAIGQSLGAAGGAASATGGTGTNGSIGQMGAPGGGGGGGITSANVAGTGGAGGNALPFNNAAGGTAGTANTNGNPGTSQAAVAALPGSGGGGGGGSITTTGGSGGNGGSYGAGGGGGGAAANGNASGGGGTAAPGLCIVMSW